MTIDQFQGEHRFLSNFYLCTVKAWGTEFPSVEHAFQASKSRHPADYARIAELSSPAEAKRAGRALELRPDWEQVKKQAMLRALLAKFIQHPELGERLASTGTQMLVEGNTWHDNYWGRCMCARCVQCVVPAQNYLGRLLMAVRLVVTVDEGS
jgi:ribA/ribD-fused uncharacterized protein